jgi:cytochrome c553
MKNKIIAFAYCLLAISSIQINVQAADAEKGKVAFETCRGCHSSAGYSNVYPTYYVPKIGGQREKYTIAALIAYKEQARARGSMTANAFDLSEKTIKNIAAHVQNSGGSISPAPAAGDLINGKKLAESCLSCHTDKLDDGGSNPILAGQYGNYLVKAMKDYQSGKRKNPIMQGMVKDLSSDDLEDIAAYFASMKGLTTTVD